MAAKIEDILQVNLVLVGFSLVNTHEETQAFRREVGTEIATVEAGIGPEVMSRTHTLNRDRITVVSNPDRTTVAREYPDEEGTKRLASVAGAAVKVTNLSEQQLRAFGYNLELVFESDPQERALQYLATRLFRADLLGNEEISLLGGSGKLFFHKHGYLWQAALEPRLNDLNTTRVFLGLNLHKEEADHTVLSEEEILGSLTLLTSEARNLVEKIDGIAP